MKSTKVDGKRAFCGIRGFSNTEKILQVRFYLVTQIIYQSKNTLIKELCESSMPL